MQDLPPLRYSDAALPPSSPSHSTPTLHSEPSRPLRHTLPSSQFRILASPPWRHTWGGRPNLAQPSPPSLLASLQGRSSPWCVSPGCAGPAPRLQNSSAPLDGEGVKADRLARPLLPKYLLWKKFWPNSNTLVRTIAAPP